MKIEQFLHFWSAHNTTIIEILIGLVLLSVVYLAFRLFFGETAEPQPGQSGLARLDSAEIQRTLQKILETQNSSTESSAPSGMQVVAPASTPPVAAPAAGADPAQLEKLKEEIQNREQTIQSLNDKIKEIMATQALAEGPPNKEIETKLKNLEDRLAEYEIISEDIADLSSYKEENARLQKEIEALKMGQPAASVQPVSSTPVGAEALQAEPTLEEQSTVESAPPVESVADVSAQSVAEAASEPEIAPTLDVIAPAAETPAAVAPAASSSPPSAAAAPPPPPAAVATAAPASAAEAAPAEVDDDLMKEFASALEEQKTAAPTTSDKNRKAIDNSNLMGEFENFVKKG